MRLLPSPPARPAAGRILFSRQGAPARDLAALDPRGMRSLRGKDIAMIFQEPMTALDPVYPIGDQIAEVLTEHEGLSRREALARAVELLRSSACSPDERVRQYRTSSPAGCASARSSRSRSPAARLPDRGRAHDGARRHRPGAGAPAHEGHPGEVRQRHPVHHPRHGRGRADGGRRDRVSRKNRRGRTRSSGASNPAHPYTQGPHRPRSRPSACRGSRPSRSPASCR